MAALMTDEDFQRVAAEFSFSFKQVGFGPFVVEWRGLVTRVLTDADPHVSVHTNGCRGARKTTLLNLIRLAVQADNKTVYMFENARSLNRVDVIHFVKTLAYNKQEVWLLIDETQDNVGGELFTPLLKNVRNHAIATIGADVPKYRSMSPKFTKKSTRLTSSCHQTK